ncbi:efflux RND transporter periplasmic adaptor subunit [Legionella sp. CNM-4043-24]|uniref:efflux RND transporter periplasmic adaptor subunit n=1 Tax=Legionella sp. CNM-4043-24 TaxID=3421646 RepID=UPI00403A99E8
MPLARNTKPGKRSVLIGAGLIALVIFLVLLRVRSDSVLAKETDYQAISVVQTMIVKPGTGSEELVLPGNVQAWHEATIYARTSGYIKKWYVDIGSHVKKGELLAEIESPEIDAQLRQADADLRTAIANEALAKSTAERWLSLVKSDFVSKQEAEEKVSAAKALTATVNSARANKERLMQLVSFERVVAPFDGIISSRTTDTGALIDADSTAVPLFRIVQSSPLRVYVQVPQSYAAALRHNMTATLHFPEYPDRHYTATLLKTASAIDPGTRTLQAQFSTDNEKGELLPGSYTEVHIKLPISTQLLRIPVNALLFQSAGLQVATIDKNNRVRLKLITVSRDFGNELEVSSGLEAGERIVLNPSDSIFDGEQVRLAR